MPQHEWPISIILSFQDNDRPMVNRGAMLARSIATDKPYRVTFG